MAQLLKSPWDLHCILSKRYFFLKSKQKILYLNQSVSVSSHSISRMLASIASLTAPRQLLQQQEVEFFPFPIGNIFFRGKASPLEIYKKRKESTQINILLALVTSIFRHVHDRLCMTNDSWSFPQLNGSPHHLLALLCNEIICHFCLDLCLLFCLMWTNSPEFRRPGILTSSELSTWLQTLKLRANM